MSKSNNASMDKNVLIKTNITTSVNVSPKSTP
jgi:hypothetical protein